MSASQHHLHDHELQALLDKTLSDAEAKRISDHLSLCPDCRRVQKDVERVDGALRRQTLANVKSDFADRVMEQLGYGTTPFLFQLFKGFSFFFALLIVVTVMSVVFVVTGVIGTGGVDTSPTTLGVLSEKTFRGIGSAVSWFNEMLRGGLPRSPSTGTLRIILWMLVGGSIVVLADKLFQWRGSHR